MELTIDQALQHGVAAHKEGKLEEAEKLYRSILATQPQHADANHNLGVLAVGVGKVQESLPLFKAALETNSNQGQYWLSYIDAFIRLGQLDNARSVLEQGRSIGLNGDQVDQLEKQLGDRKNTHSSSIDNKNDPIQQQIDDLVGLYSQSNFKDALVLGDRLAKQFPTNHIIPNILGAIYAGLSQHEKAIMNFNKVIELKPNFAGAYNNLGVALNELGKNQEAITHYNKAIELKPDYAETHNNLGNAFIKLSKHLEATISYNRAIELKPDYAEAHNNLGNTFSGLGKSEEAIDNYNKAIELKPDYAEAYNNMGIVLGKLGRYQEVITSYNKAIELRPNYAEAYSNLGIALKNLGKYEEAINTLNKAIELNPKSAETYNNLGIVLKNTGKREEAISSYNKAIGLSPNYADAYNNLGLALKNLGKYREAISSYNKATELKPRSGEIYNNFGNILNEIGKYEQAVTSYKKAIVLKPDYADAYWNKHGLSRNISDAINIVSKTSIVDPSHTTGLITTIGLTAITGSTDDFYTLENTKLSRHPVKRSFDWFFKLTETPVVYFDRWHFFDDMIKLSDKSRPFYEFGVWMGVSFKYLSRTFKKGFGFDTFSGLPEDWHKEEAGIYSSKGIIPEVEGGEFIEGKFEDTLPIFFSKKRPKASIINFDADLYSSTICALRNSRNIIDEKTILIFDEFITNEYWEQDEYKALNDFCNEFDLNYKVVAVSFFTKQVAIKLLD